MRCCQVLHLPQQSHHGDGGNDVSELSVLSNSPAEWKNSDSILFFYAIVSSFTLQFYYLGSPGWICYHKTSAAPTMAWGDWQNQITRVRKHRLFMKASHFNNCHISRGASVEWMCPLSVLSAPFLFPDSVFIWLIQTCCLGACRESWREQLRYFPLKQQATLPGFSYFTHSIMNNER